MKTSQAGLTLIKKYEGCKLVAYKLKGEQYNTIGYGHYGADVTDGMVITQARAEELLKTDLAKFEGYVQRYVTDIPLTQCRFDALVSYCYNRGPGGMKQLAANCKTVREYSEGIVKYWGSATRYKKALVNRRKAEKALFDLDGPRETDDLTERLAWEVIDGKAGTGAARRAYIIERGGNPSIVQARINDLKKQGAF